MKSFAVIKNIFHEFLGLIEFKIHGEILIKYGSINDSLHHATTPKPQKWELLLSGNARN